MQPRTFGDWLDAAIDVIERTVAEVDPAVRPRAMAALDSEMRTLKLVRQIANGYGVATTKPVEPTRCVPAESMRK